MGEREIFLQQALLVLMMTTFFVLLLSLIGTTQKNIAENKCSFRARLTISHFVCVLLLFEECEFL